MELYRKEHLAPTIIFLAQERELERNRLDEEINVYKTIKRLILLRQEKAMILSS